MKFSDTPKITVAIRKRPLNRKELQRSETDIVRVSQGGSVTVSEFKQKVDLTKYLQETTFNFDFAFDETSTNEEIYELSIRPLIENAFKGAKISCFAYGQTGSGKTHTMKGDLQKGIPGLYYLGAREIFRLIEQPQFRHLHVGVSFYEIYCGRLYDLLNSRSELKIREDNKQNIHVIGLEQRMICSANEFLEVIEFGSGFRVTAQNATNSDSSRSHAIMQITLRHQKKVFTKISFIDLAGNERGADHIDQNKQTKIDGAEINKSLLSLKECIRALDQGKSHTPFRGSKLTMVLKDSFVGFCNTVMICNVSPNSFSSENTMNTLRYADRVKELKSSQGELTREEMLARELMLPRANNKNCIKVNIDNEDDQEDLLIKLDEARNNQGQSSTQLLKFNEEERMDIEQPYENKRSLQLQNPRRAENITNQMKLFNMAQRRGQAVGHQIGSKQIALTNNVRGRGIEEKQPLNMRNNNLNFGNSQQEFDLTKRPHFGNNMRKTTEINRAQFDAMNRLKQDLMHYQEEHENLVGTEMAVIHEESLMKDNFRKANPNYSCYEEQLGDVNNFLGNMQQGIRQKLQIVRQMQLNLQKMRNSVQNASSLTLKMREQQQECSQRHANTQLFNNEHSNSNACRSQGRTPLFNNNFINFHQQHHNDQQLLEGLPGDDSMTRLF